MQREVHVFDNGVKVYDDHLIPVQRERYEKRNVHEAEEEDIFVRIIRSIPVDGCFVNIGSAIGYYPLLAKKLVPSLTVHAVEPLKLHRDFFIENVQLNGLSTEDFFLHVEGIAASRGVKKFLEADYSSFIQNDNTTQQSLKSSVKSTVKAILATLGFKKYKSTVENLARIRTITLDDLIRTIKQSVDLLQMDVQGLEADILRGGSHALTNGSISTFLIGTHGYEVHWECVNLLQSYDYQIEFEENDVKEQPDGIIVASKGTKRLDATNSLP
jgi:FkbM family methyltransferase